MRMTNYKLASPVVIAAISFCSLVACNNRDYKTSDSNSSASDSSVSASRGTDSMSTATTTTTVHKRKGKTSIRMAETESKEKIAKDKEGVYNWAETMPEFPGGQNALDNYVNNNIEYPQPAIDDNISGTVRVSFVVDENGKVSRAQVVGTKLGNGLDEQAVKVVNNMPAWKPGKVHGKSVKTRLQLPISFQVEA
jgi:periplasmic protein TonB